MITKKDAGPLVGCGGVGLMPSLLPTSGLPASRVLRGELLGSRIEFFYFSSLAPRNSLLATSHAAAAVVAEVAVAGADGDRAAVVAGGCVRLEVGELFAAGGVDHGVLGHDAGAGEEGAHVAVAVGVTVGMTIGVTVFGGEGWGLGAGG